MSNFIEEGNLDDMDNMDWINFIDEYHCPDYWISVDELEPVDDDECDSDYDDELSDEWPDKSEAD